MRYRDNLKQAMKKIALAGALTMALSGAAFATPQDDLRNAVEYNRPALVQKYVAQGVDPNLKTRDGTPLLVDAREPRARTLASFCGGKSGAVLHRSQPRSLRWETPPRLERVR